MSQIIIAWFSCGITSAVACKIALQTYKDVVLYYTDTGSQEEDSLRFLHDCEQWFGQKINIVRSKEYTNHFDVIEKKGLISKHNYYPCTFELKKRLRYQIEDDLKYWDGQVWGFDISETNRAQRMIEQYPNMKPLFPLIDNQLSKANCACLLAKEGIEIPRMYKMGYHNNNCIGCIRGGMGYWNKIRIDFPEDFERMAKLERVVGHSCLKERIGNETKALFLDELSPDRGDFPTEIMPECGLFCELEFMN